MPPGIWFHDRVGAGTRLSVAPPAGEFFLDQESHGPVVLLSGGVGLMPMVSMVEQIARRKDGRQTWYVHGARDGRVHAMGRHARKLAARACNNLICSWTDCSRPPLP